MKMLLLGILLGLVGCAGMPPVELCYVHPVYGQVCVQVGGKKHYAEDLTPEQRQEVEAWIAKQK